MSNPSDFNQDPCNTNDLNQDEVSENVGTTHAIKTVAKVIGVDESIIRDWIRTDSSLPDDTRKWLDEAIQGGQHLERIDEQHSIATKYDAVMRCTARRQSVKTVSNRLQVPYSVVEGWVTYANKIKIQYNSTFKSTQVGIRHLEVSSGSNMSTETDDQVGLTGNMLSQNSSKPHGVKKEDVNDADPIR